MNLESNSPNPDMLNVEPTVDNISPTDVKSVIDRMRNTGLGRRFKSIATGLAMIGMVATTACNAERPTTASPEPEDSPDSGEIQTSPEATALAESLTMEVPTDEAEATPQTNNSTDIVSNIQSSSGGTTFELSDSSPSKPTDEAHTIEETSEDSINNYSSQANPEDNSLEQHREPETDFEQVWRWTEIPLGSDKTYDLVSADGSLIKVTFNDILDNEYYFHILDTETQQEFAATWDNLVTMEQLQEGITIQVGAHELTVTLGENINFPEDTHNDNPNSMENTRPEKERPTIAVTFTEPDQNRRTDNQQ